LKPPIAHEETIMSSSSNPSRTGQHMVFCVKFQREMPGLDEPPFDNELGQRIYDNVSRDAWNMWTEHCKMILNEYRLNPANRQHQELIVQQLEQFFFGEGAALPPDYVPQKKS
jgi:Fe-S cluster biosynthesis and repair protein YggX